MKKEREEVNMALKEYKKGITHEVSKDLTDYILKGFRKQEEFVVYSTYDTPQRVLISIKEDSLERYYKEQGYVKLIETGEINTIVSSYKKMRYKTNLEPYLYNLLKKKDSENRETVQGNADEVGKVADKLKGLGYQTSSRGDNGFNILKLKKDEWGDSSLWVNIGTYTLDKTVLRLTDKEGFVGDEERENIFNIITEGKQGAKTIQELRNNLEQYGLGVDNEGEDTMVYTKTGGNTIATISIRNNYVFDIRFSELIRKNLGYEGLNKMDIYYITGNILKYTNTGIDSRGLFE